jgi:hypothetical protein
LYTTCSKVGIVLYWTQDSMNNLSSYCGLIDSRMSASDTDLPVTCPVTQWKTQKLSFQKQKCPLGTQKSIDRKKKQSRFRAQNLLLFCKYLTFYQPFWNLWPWGSNQSQRLNYQFYLTIFRFKFVKIKYLSISILAFD